MTIEEFLKRHPKPWHLIEIGTTWFEDGRGVSIKESDLFKYIQILELENIQVRELAAKADPYLQTIFGRPIPGRVQTEICKVCGGGFVSHSEIAHAECVMKLRVAERSST